MAVTLNGDLRATVDEGLGLLAPDLRSAVVRELHRGRVFLRKYLEGAAFDWQRASASKDRPPRKLG